MHPRWTVDLQIDEVNESHLASHAISSAEVVQVWLNAPLYVPNKKGRAATWLMLGDTAGGRGLTVAVLVLDPELLRPITGWDSTTGELTRWR